MTVPLNVGKPDRLPSARMMLVPLARMRLLALPSAPAVSVSVPVTVVSALKDAPTALFNSRLP